jgi:hypothetical protein
MNGFTRLRKGIETAEALKGWRIEPGTKTTKTLCLLSMPMALGSAANGMVERLK